MVTAGFGIIPTWQYSGDPAVNIKLNPNVVFPPGMDQLTIQPVGHVGHRDLYVMAQGSLSGSGMFDSWWWRNRKWVLLGGLGLAAFGAFKLLR